MFTDAFLPSTSALAALLRGQRVIVVLLWHGLLFGQWFQALDVLIGLVQLRQRNPQVGLRSTSTTVFSWACAKSACAFASCALACMQLGFVLALVEREEHLPRL